jgi:hypothetical protein
MRVGREEPEAATGTWEDFLIGFRRSRRGNLWRDWQGATLTVFPRGGAFCWCFCDREGPRYSPERYGTETEAVRALWGALQDEPME